ncbi:uncharacterized protein LOC123300392 [Chrysoperla carnea]|uniref:uncharacterized protein LOC123300392 n=1 Tax=Chrysoperla carnea TaxID=189513 RepID=UPI001D06D61E|nr:uncharacterized protein LOC123300392 [Chrysoperla carnea]
MEQTYDRHNKKLLSLISIQQPRAKQMTSNDRRNDNKPRQTAIHNQLNIVKNISTKELSTEELQLLNKGLNFSLKPLKTPIIDIIADVETTIKRAPESVKHQIRRNVLPILRPEEKEINHHITHHKAVKSLTEKGVTITKADKGNAVVVLDKEDYIRRMEKLLREGPYERVEKDPLQKNIKEVKEVIKQCQALIGSRDRLKLQSSNPLTSRLYGLPKIHKEGDGMRPIVSGINSPTYKIAKWLVSEFNKFNKPTGDSVLNSMELIEKLKGVNLVDGDKFVSFDVTALFPSVPINKALDHLEEWLTENNVPELERGEYLQLTRLCMEQTYFQFNEKFYKQVHGTSMGNPLSPFLANIFMSRLERNLKQAAEYFPQHWYRYVDDIFTIIDTKKTSVHDFLEFLNKAEPSIKFTVEEEQDEKLPFLDLEISRDSDKLAFNIYRKPTNVDRFIPKDSFSHWSHKMAAFNFLVHRLTTYPLSTTNYKKELDYIKNVAVLNGYSTNVIDQLLKKAKWRKSLKETTTLSTEEPVLRTSLTFYGKKTSQVSEAMQKYNTNLQVAYTSKGKLRSMLCNTKDRIPNNKKSGIYKVDCADCSKGYIGQTARSLSVRYKEHIAHFNNKRKEKSSVASHAMETGHQIGEIKLLKLVNIPSKLDAYESLYINRMGKNALNSDKGPVPFSDLYSLCVDASQSTKVGQPLDSNKRTNQGPVPQRTKHIRQAKITKFLTVN